jgi:hypothetical protein
MTMNDSYERSRRARVLVGLAGVLVALVIGVAAYDAGVSHGLAQQIAATGTGAHAYAYPWPRPWGFGFGFLFPLLFGFLLLRLVLWGGFGRRHWGHGRGYGCAGPYDVPPAFEEWHRRVHERGPQGPAATGV